MKTFLQLQKGDKVYNVELDMLNQRVNLTEYEVSEVETTFDPQSGGDCRRVIRLMNENIESPITISCPDYYDKINQTFYEVGRNCVNVFYTTEEEAHIKVESLYDEYHKASIIATQTALLIQSNWRRNQLRFNTEDNIIEKRTKELEARIGTNKE